MQRVYLEQMSWQGSPGRLIKILCPGLTLSLAVALSGCTGGPGRVPAPIDTSTTTQSPASTSTPSPLSQTPSAPAPASGGSTLQAGPLPTSSQNDAVKTYAHNQVSFAYPADWTVVRESSTSVQVLDEHQQRVASFAADIPQGASPCGMSAAHIITLEEIPLNLPMSTKVKGIAYAAPHFAFTLIEGAKIWGTMAITGFEQTADGIGCYVSNKIVGPEDSTGDYSFGDCVVLDMEGRRTGRLGYVTTTIPEFASVDDAKAFMKTPYYAKLKNMLISLRIAPLQ